MSQAGKRWKLTSRKDAPGTCAWRGSGTMQTCWGGKRTAPSRSRLPRPGPHTYLPVNIGHLPAQDHTADSALHLLPFKGCPVGLGEGHVAGDCPFVLQIHLPESWVMLDTGTMCTLSQDWRCPPNPWPHPST